MPIGWTRVSGTPDELRGLLRDPQAFAQKVEELVADAGASVGHIWWTAGAAQALILTHIPKTDAAAIRERLNAAIGPTDLSYTVEEIELRYDQEIEPGQ
jgi:hypothetical protein